MTKNINLWPVCGFYYKISVSALRNSLSIVKIMQNIKHIMFFGICCMTDPSIMFRILILDIRCPLGFCISRCLTDSWNIASTAHKYTPSSKSDTRRKICAIAEIILPHTWCALLFPNSSNNCQFGFFYKGTIPKFSRVGKPTRKRLPSGNVPGHDSPYANLLYHNLKFS